jgi:hypothetical protein
MINAPKNIVPNIEVNTALELNVVLIVNTLSMIFKVHCK